MPDASQIKVNYSAKYWTNQDVIVRVESNIADFGIQISTDVKIGIQIQHMYLQLMGQYMQDFMIKQRKKLEI